LIAGVGTIAALSCSLAATLAPRVAVVAIMGVAAGVMARRWPGVVAAFAWTGLWAIDDYLPPSLGLAVSGTFLVLVLALTDGWPRHLIRLARSSALEGAWFLTLIAVLLLHPTSPFSTTRPAQVFYGVILGTVVAIVTVRRSVRAQFLVGAGFIGLALAFAEVVRVAQGGSSHTEMISFGLNPIDVARMTGLTSVVFLWMASRTARTSLKLVLLLGSAIALAGTLATGSRGPFAALVVAALVILIGGVAGPTRLVALVAGGATAYWASGALGTRSISWSSTDDSDRLLTWQQAAQTAIDNPLIGAGLGRYAGTSDRFARLDYPHNIFLQVGAELGFVAGLLFLAFGAKAYLRGGQIERAILVFAGICVSVSGHLGQSQLWWVALGLCASRWLRDQDYGAEAVDAPKTVRSGLD
jgi:O-antigen ligase